MLSAPAKPRAGIVIEQQLATILLGESERRIILGQNERRFVARSRRQSDDVVDRSSLMIATLSAGVRLRQWS
jgi:hypothetical protein